MQKILNNIRLITPGIPTIMEVNTENKLKLIYLSRKYAITAKNINPNKKLKVTVLKKFLKLE